MVEIDYIVVGLGLAGMAFCEQLTANHKEFLVIESGGASASRVSGGVYNPVILKRYTLPWEAEKLMDIAVPYYEQLTKKLQLNAMFPTPVLRLFSSAEDQNNWFEALDKPGLSRFLSPKLEREPINGIDSIFHYGRVRETGRIDVPAVLDAYKAHLIQKKQWLDEVFEHEQIVIENDHVMYKNYRARYIVFAEGYGVKKNPFFAKLPVVGNKGEYIFIKAEKLILDAALKSQFFIIPQGNQRFKVGATFNGKDKDNNPTQSAREEILLKLRKVLTCEFEVVDQEAGVRPTTGDRRPLLGKHPHYPNLALLNGLGTRGIMMSPYLAGLLYENLENGIKLPQTVDVMRFPKKFEKR
ncbi:NAD(P)/FAD-dependent oxidoreductase [Flavimarina sp. Hel_I_48]|uniref:NAD(P)/FAD-dependent oxidoreductase n=1 Tax=Flavimarina sp. Hel_I_48 TaxID=1392488 RepID=UPI0004DFB4DD|nr:FAD-dependent oxidoreductase [Flavimarina sp. Hel_I_48]